MYQENNGLNLKLILAQMRLSI